MKRSSLKYFSYSSNLAPHIWLIGMFSCGVIDNISTFLKILYLVSKNRRTHWYWHTAGRNYQDEQRLQLKHSQNLHQGAYFKILSLQSLLSGWILGFNSSHANIFAINGGTLIHGCWLLLYWGAGTFTINCMKYHTTKPTFSINVCH